MTVESDYKRAARRFLKAKEDLERARADLHAAMRAGRQAGMTYDALAREVGVTRQRVMRILRD